MSEKLLRRTFLKTTGATAFAVGSGTDVAQAGNPGMTKRKPASAGGLQLSNSRIELVFDESSGALVSLTEKLSKRRIELPGPAAAPVRVRLGGRDGTVEHDIVICRDVPREVEMKTTTGKRDTTLQIRWPDLVNSGHRTGLELSCSFTLSSDANCVRVRTSLRNRGRHWVNWLFLGLEGLALNQDAGQENLMVGDVAGEPLANPRYGLKATKILVDVPSGKRTFSIPPTMPIGLVFGWMDFSDSTGGIGTGYLNRGEYDMVGHVEGTGDGLNLGWRHFCLEDSRAFMWGYDGDKQVYALAPGEQFTSDEWVLVIHDGNWHETAYAYRQRCEKVFQDDFLDWEKTASPVRNCDVVLNSHVAWGNPPKDPKTAYDYPSGRVFNRFQDLPKLVAEAVRRLSIKPANVILNVLGTATMWGIYKMPDHLPMSPEAGGQQAAEEAFRKIRDQGISGIVLYGHPYFLHRQARNYLPAADTGMNYPHMDWHTSMGGIACMAIEEWHELWAQEIYPGFIRAGVAGIYFDEGFGHQFICTKPGHSHGDSSLSALSAQSRGATRLYRTWREMATSNNGFLSCEGGSDVQARWIDLWHLPATETLRFTHPDKMCMVGVNPGNIRASIARAYLLGCPLLIGPFPSPARTEKLEGELLAALRDFVAARQQLRESKAFGYPFAFRDQLGLTIKHQGMEAKLYATAEGATVVYYTPQPFEGEVIIDAKRLGWQGPRLWRERLRTRAGEMGFVMGSRH
ncbi:MAG TPA: hypothetical protein PLP42_16335 [Acidobacteriota bacterium]|nr:hypothetical protein [Acidobacteriota bacterium]